MCLITTCQDVIQFRTLIDVSLIFDAYARVSDVKRYVGTADH
jgi:hypothetical protein